MNNVEHIYADIREGVNIRERVAASLKARKMTQKALAEAVGVTPQEINNFLRGRQPISLPKLERIFAILGL